MHFPWHLRVTKSLFTSLPVTVPARNLSEWGGECPKAQAHGVISQQPQTLRKSAGLSQPYSPVQENGANALCLPGWLDG